MPAPTRVVPGTDCPTPARSAPCHARPVRADVSCPAFPAPPDWPFHVTSQPCRSDQPLHAGSALARPTTHAVPRRVFPVHADLPSPSPVMSCQASPRRPAAPDRPSPCRAHSDLPSQAIPSLPPRLRKPSRARSPLADLPRQALASLAAPTGQAATGQLLPCHADWPFHFAASPDACRPTSRVSPAPSTPAQSLPTYQPTGGDQ